MGGSYYMRVQELRIMARQAFGENLEHATPSNVREFLDDLQKRDWLSGKSERASSSGNGKILDLSAYAGSAGIVSWESQMRRFFSKALDRSPDEAAAALWLFALEMAYSGIEEMQAEGLDRLFHDSGS